MRLEDYWGVGPKTRERLEATIGTEAAARAIETADSRALMGAGLSRGRATRILRRANGGAGMDVLATGDAREVYRDLLDLAREFAVTRHAADQIRVLTPLRSPADIETRLDDVQRATESWATLDDATRSAALAAFDGYDSIDGGERAAVEAALALHEAGATDGVFDRVAALDADALAEAADALGHLDRGQVREGADGRLDRLRETLVAVEDLEARGFDVLDAIRDGGVQGTDEFREAFVQYVLAETDASREAVRDAMATDPQDAADFVSATLRALAADLRERATERNAEVAVGLQQTIADARGVIDEAVEAVDDLAFHVSLARFAAAYDLTRPEIITDRETVAVVGARNLSLAAGDERVQPVTYAVGDHGLDGPPAGDRVAVLTGANSGGKTTLLETLAQVALLAQMGLPVPAEAAEVSVVDAVVFHRRHASFNAGVLESTLRSIIPPLSGDGRTLMLVDEFEAITEPGSAADLLHGLVRLTVDRTAAGVFVTHLAEDLEPLPDAARIDGIFAEGLGPDLELRVDYQPRFDTLGRSTPEFIVSRLVAGADGRGERAAFETLAEAVGQDIVQRTLADARWADAGER